MSKDVLSWPTPPVRTPPTSPGRARPFTAITTTKTCFDGHGIREVSGIINCEQAAWMPRAFEVVRSCQYMFGHVPTLVIAFLNAYPSGLNMNRPELQAAALAYGVQADRNVWALEEIYLHGNARARPFIPHAPFRPFASFWLDIQEALEV